MIVTIPLGLFIMVIVAGYSIGYVSNMSQLSKLDDYDTFVIVTMFVTIITTIVWGMFLN